MGSFILCHKKKARDPYRIARIHCRIYTIEELCYYLCNNLYLIDHTVVNEQLCDWLEQELDLEELARSLRDLLQEESPVELFVMQILSYTSLYTTAELNQVQQLLEQVKNQKPMKKQKFMADNLLENGSTRSAIDLYLAILRQPKEEVDDTFCGEVYANLGAAYGRMFQYEEAAQMYEEAYRRLKDSRLLAPYIYACEQSMPALTFQSMLAQNEIFAKVHEENLHIVEEVSQNDIWLTDEELDNWKEQYRRSAAGDR